MRPVERHEVLGSLISLTRPPRPSSTPHWPWFWGFLQSILQLPAAFRFLSSKVLQQKLQFVDKHPWLSHLLLCIWGISGGPQGLCSPQWASAGVAEFHNNPNVHNNFNKKSPKNWISNIKHHKHGWWCPLSLFIVRPLCLSWWAVIVISCKDNWWLRQITCLSRNTCFTLPWVLGAIYKNPVVEYVC